MIVDLTVEIRDAALAVVGEPIVVLRRLDQSY